jgi:hypothetical protein
MPTLRVGLDDETYYALLADAERHLRPGERHMAALLRQALGLPVPLPPDITPASKEEPCVLSTDN